MPPNQYEWFMIRPVLASDMEAVCEIYNEYILHATATFEVEPVTAGEMERRMGEITPRCPYFVWTGDDGRVDGYAYAHPWQERAAYGRTWETTVYVRRGYAGRGIGSALMRRLIEECRWAGCHALVACITAENADSRRMHERLGFRQVSLFREVGWKFDRWLDVTDYELLLNEERRMRNEE